MSKTAWQYGGVCFAWGASYLFMRVAAEGLSPGQVVLARLVLGAFTLFGCMWVGGKRWPRDLTYWAHLVVIATSACVVPHLLLAWASEEMPSVLVSVCTSLTPLLTILVTVGAFRQERVTFGAVVGVVIGAAGIVVVLSPWSAGSEVSVGRYLACLAASACYAISFAYTRRFVTPRSPDAVATAAGQIGVAAVVVVVLSPIIARGAIELTPAVLSATICLGIVGTGISYVWYQTVINGWGATAASTITYLMPVVGIALGAFVLDERLSWDQLGGASIVIAGVVLSRKARGTGASRPQSAESP